MIKFLLKKAPSGTRENGTSLKEGSQIDYQKKSWNERKNHRHREKDDFAKEWEEDDAKFQLEECGRCPDLRVWERRMNEENKSVWKFEWRAGKEWKKFCSSPFQIASKSVGSSKAMTSPACRPKECLMNPIKISFLKFLPRFAAASRESSFLCPPLLLDACLLVSVGAFSEIRGWRKKINKREKSHRVECWCLFLRLWSDEAHQQGAGDD